MNLRDDLKAYLDGELPAERMAEMREAIDRDPLLAQEAEELGRISQTLQAVAAQPVATGLEETLRALEKGERRERKPWWPWLVPVAGMASALVFVVAPTMNQAKMAAKGDASVAFVRSEESASLASPRRDSDFMDPREVQELKAPSNGSDGVGAILDRNKTRSGISKHAPGAASSPPGAVSGTKSLEGRKTVRNGDALRALSTPRKATAPVKAPTGLSTMNARAGDTKGQPPALQGDISRTKNFAVEPEGKQNEKLEGPVLGVRVAVAKAAVETVFVDVDSLAEADDTVRELVDRLGAALPPVVAQKAVADSTASYSAQRDQAITERRVILEVDADRVAETKKQVSEAVKETQTRREAQSSRMRGGMGGGGGAFDGANRTQQSESQGGRQGPPVQSQGTGQQATGQAFAQGKNRGGSGFQGAPAPEGQKIDPATKRTATGAKAQSSKPRKRIEIIVRVKPKPPGKLEE